MVINITHGQQARNELWTIKKESSTKSPQGKINIDDKFRKTNNW